MLPRGHRGGPRGNSRGGGPDRGGRGRGRGGSPGRGRGGVNRPPPPRGPPGVCSYYWEYGSCRRGYDCNFRHEAKPATAPVGSLAGPNEELSFFSAEGMAENSGSHRRGFQDMTPQAVHNNLKSFIAQNRDFSSASRVEGFVRLFSSVDARNKHWSIDDAQEFLDFVVQNEANNTFYLLGEALRWQTISTRVAAGNRSTLSFQRGYLPLMEFFTSSLILRSTIHHNVNKLYTLVENNYDAIHATVLSNVSALIEARNWKDPDATHLPESHQADLGGVRIFQALYIFFYQYFKIFKGVIRNHPDILALVESIGSWFDTWADAVTSSGTIFPDSITDAPPRVRQLTLEQLRTDIYRLRSIVRREAGVADEQRLKPRGDEASTSDIHEAFVNRLEQTYTPPGILRDGGPRHDNDHVDISAIRIAPTHDELFNSLQPYLPNFVPGGPHHLPSGSIEKHLDIQFRLLREEMIATIRHSIAAINAELAIRREPARRRETQLDTLLKNRGGAFRSSGADSVFFHLYTNIKFTPPKADRRAFTIGLAVDSPPGAARDKESRVRQDFWEHSKRLASGSVVALLLVKPDMTRVFLGTIASGNNDVAESSKVKKDRIELRVSFFDPEVELLALRSEEISPPGDRSTFAILLDNSIMYESLRPFLKTLQTVEPTSIPFAEYIASEGSLATVHVPPPRYARVPGFSFDLKCLLPNGTAPLRLDVGVPETVQAARARLRTSSSLDASQAETIVDALTRQICLVQGPPGTGKSFTGKELLRVLLTNDVRPIVLIAYTNHALDHMLRSVLDANITKKLVRLGSRSSDDMVAEYSLFKLEAEIDRGVSPLDSSRRREFRRMKEIEEEIQVLMEDIQIPRMHWTMVQDYLSIHHPDAEMAFSHPPRWIGKLHAAMIEEEESGGGWTIVESKRKKSEHGVPKTLYGFWKGGYDLGFLSAIPEDVDEDPRVAFFMSLGIDVIPEVPSLRVRDIQAFLSVNSPWSLLALDRHRLAKIWEDEVRHISYQTKLQEFEDLRQQYEETCTNLNNINDQTRQNILTKTDLIGCTTTGAAKLVALLTTVAPKVLVVEEAGQVLESHILASLVPSVEHLICIGDPEQLRPTLANYGLSMDSERGKRLFKFDRSLLERLSNNGCPMSLINTQRRMRPDISQYPRSILYPTLEDHPLVQHYPHVSGIPHNVFFFSHTHAENDDQDSVSKHNMFEVGIIKDLVMYLLKQGKYSGKGDIAVLCAYLGQLQKVRAALHDAKLAVSVDERDEQALALRGAEGVEGSFENVDVARHIRLGTVDTFQGLEAKIVIISLVRNSGDFSGDAAIGFLKSSNRINVAVSRAQHGMFIFGNSSNLRQNRTWETIIANMESQGLVGTELPIVCPRHPDELRFINAPGQIPILAPEGGCISKITCT